MLHLCIDSEILAAAAAVWLRLSGRNEMPDNSQTKTCVGKTMKTHRKINISRLDLSTKEVARELTFVLVSPQQNTLFSGSNLKLTDGLTGSSGAQLPSLHSLIAHFHPAKNTASRDAKNIS